MVEDRLIKMLELKKAFECVAIIAPAQMRKYYKKVTDDIQDIIINEAKLLLIENQSAGNADQSELAIGSNQDDDIVKKLVIDPIINSCKMEKKEKAVNLSDDRDDLKKDEDILRDVQSLLDEVDLERYTPAGNRKLAFGTDRVVNDILKILMLHKFTEEELEIIFTLVRYRITGVFKFFETLEKQ